MPKPSNLQQRFFSSLFLIPSALLLILFGKTSWIFLLALCSGFMLHEWDGLYQSRRQNAHAHRTVSPTAWWIAGSLYVGLPIFATFYLSMTADRLNLLWLIAMVVATDIGAYCIGRILKGPKVAPHISAGKTWSGVMGGMLCAACMGLIFASWGTAPLPFYVGIGLVVAVLAQMGDFLESALKRYAGVKDSGSIIPGHGGVLDRLDGYIIVLPLGALFLHLHPAALLTYA